MKTIYGLRLLFSGYYNHVGEGLDSCLGFKPINTRLLGLRITKGVGGITVDTEQGEGGITVGTEQGEGGQG